MPDKKLTDAEIKKALECCASGDDGCEKGCPFHPVCTSPIKTMENLIKLALDLINRQQAEIERLKAYYKDEFEKLTITYTELLVKKTQEIKAEAYKEFAYELQQIPRKTVFKSEIRSLLKEKVGGDV